VSVRVSGVGVAAATAAHCLAARGLGLFAARARSGTARAAPVVMLGQQAQMLLTDVFGTRLASVAQAHPIERRVVLWGGGEPQAFDHRALVIGGESLGDLLPWPDPTEPGLAATFELTTMPPAPAYLLQFGSREAAAAPVVLRPAADRGAALVEALDQGWLFLIPTGGDAGWLLAVGGDPAALLRESRLVAPVVAQVGAVVAKFETAPRLLDNPCTPDQLALGSAALAFDPICGDGTATAVRGGILAAAVGACVAGVDLPGLDRAVLLGHYRAMMIAAMRRHLTISWPFYARAGNSAWWREAADQLAEGHAWCTRQLAAAGEARFVLVGDRLILREQAA